MFAKFVTIAALVAAAHAGVYTAPVFKYAPVASSYQYETRVHSAPVAYATKFAAPLAYAAPLAKVAPVAYAAPVAKFAYAPVSVTHHSYAHAPLLAAPKFYGAPLAYAPALW